MLKNCRELSFVCLFFVTGISVKVYSSFKLHLSCLLFLVTLSCGGERIWKERKNLSVAVTPEALHRMVLTAAAPRVRLT